MINNPMAMADQIKILCNTSSYNFADYPDRLQLIKNPHRRRLSEEELMHLVEQHNPVGILAGVEPITEKIMMAATQLKVISRCGIDTETIDLKTAKKLGIEVLRTSLAPDVPASELTLAVILALVRKLPVLDNLVRTGNWERKVTGLLKGKMIGIIGCGILGTRVSRMLYAFECGLIGYDPYVKMHDYCEMVKFDSLIKNSDIITLHMPLRSENYHIIGTREIENMKQGAIVVNTSRPGLVDEEALVVGLRSGKLGGVALDVFEEEPYSGPLLEFKENTILTPHIGSHAGSYRFDIEKEAMINLLNALKKQGIEV
ncbi:NAD(P)-dependent oxidoreductase [Bacteroidota bacterium]